MATMVGDSYAVASGGVIAGGRQYVSQYYRDLAPGFTNISDALPAPKPPYGIAAFSGITLDSERGKLHWFGGGHADYWGDEVWELDLETRAGFTKNHEPTVSKYVTAAEMALLIDNVNYPGAMILPGGVLRPISRHNGNTQCWIPSIRKFFVEGTSLYSGVAGSGNYLTLELGGVYPTDAKDRWLYSPDTGLWDYEGADYNSIQINRLGGSNVYHHGRDLMYSASALSSVVSIRSWNPHTKAIELVTQVTVGTTSRTTIAIDDANDYIYLLSFSNVQANPAQLRRYHIQSDTWTTISCSGDVRDSYGAAYQKAVFSTKTGNLLLMYNTSLGMSTINPNTGVWTTSAIAPTNMASCFNGWIFDRRRKVAFLSHIHAGASLKLWIYKEP